MRQHVGAAIIKKWQPFFVSIVLYMTLSGIEIYGNDTIPWIHYDHLYRNTKSPLPLDRSFYLVVEHEQRLGRITNATIHKPGKNSAAANGGVLQTVESQSGSDKVLVRPFYEKGYEIYITRKFPTDRIDKLVLLAEKARADSVFLSTDWKNFARFYNQLDSFLVDADTSLLRKKNRLVFLKKEKKQNKAGNSKLKLILICVKSILLHDPIYHLHDYDISISDIYTEYVNGHIDTIEEMVKYAYLKEDESRKVDRLQRRKIKNLDVPSVGGVTENKAIVSLLKAYDDIVQTTVNKVGNETDYYFAPSPVDLFDSLRISSVFDTPATSFTHQDSMHGTGTKAPRIHFIRYLAALEADTVSKIQNGKWRIFEGRKASTLTERVNNLKYNKSVLDTVVLSMLNEAKLLSPVTSAIHDYESWLSYASTIQQNIHSNYNATLAQIERIRNFKDVSGELAFEHVQYLDIPGKSQKVDTKMNMHIIGNLGMAYIMFTQQETKYSHEQRSDNRVSIKDYKWSRNTAIRPYFGFEVRFRPRDVDISFAELRRERLNDVKLKDWLAYKVSANVGVTLATVASRNERADAFGKLNFLSGLSIGIGRYLRVGTGVMIYKKVNPNPLIDSARLACAPMFSADIQIKFDQLSRAIAAIFGVTN